MSILSPPRATGLFNVRVRGAEGGPMAGHEGEEPLTEKPLGLFPRGYHDVPGVMRPLHCLHTEPRQKETAPVSKGICWEEAYASLLSVPRAALGLRWGPLASAECPEPPSLVMSPLAGPGGDCGVFT